MPLGLLKKNLFFFFERGYIVPIRAKYFNMRHFISKNDCLILFPLGAYKLQGIQEVEIA